MCYGPWLIPLLNFFKPNYLCFVLWELIIYLSPHRRVRSWSWQCKLLGSPPGWYRVAICGHVRFSVGANPWGKSFKTLFCVSPKEMGDLLDWCPLKIHGESSSFFERETDTEWFSWAYVSPEFQVPLPLELQECLRTSLSSCVCAKSLRLCLTLCDPMDCSPPGSSVRGISQARILEWADISSTRGSSWHRDQTLVSYVSCTGRQVLYHQPHLGSPGRLSSGPSEG